MHVPRELIDRNTNHVPVPTIVTPRIRHAKAITAQQVDVILLAVQSIVKQTRKHVIFTETPACYPFSSKYVGKQPTFQNIGASCQTRGIVEGKALVK